MESNKLCSPEDLENFKLFLSAELSRLRIPEIKHMVMRLHLPRSGNKSELVSRLVAQFEAFNHPKTLFQRDQLIELIRQQLIAYQGFSRLPELFSSTGGEDAAAAGSNGVSGAVPPFAPVGGEGNLGGRAPVPFTFRLNVGAGNGGNPSGWPGSAPASASGSLAALGRQQGGPGGPHSAPAGKLAGTFVQCVCGQAVTPWDEVKCAECHIAFHDQCYGTSMRARNKTFSAACFLCLSRRQNPFLEVVETLVPPSRVTSRARMETNFQFKLSHQQQRDMLASRQGGSRNEGSLQLLVRCFPLNLLETARPSPGHDEGKLPFYPTHCWPLESQLRVNTECVPIKQRQTYFYGSQRKSKGHSEPVDVFLLARTGINRVGLMHNDEGKGFVIMVQIVKVVGVQRLLRKVVESPDTPTAEESLERIRQSFRGCSVDSDTEDGELMATVTRLSLRCPLGMTPIRIPARGTDCHHLQCFDLDTFLRYNERGAAAGWRCGVCNMVLTLEGLRVDAFMRNILAQIEARKEMNEDLDSIEINHQGEWELFNSSAASSRKRKAEGNVAGEEEGKAVSDGKVVDPEVADDDDVALSDLCKQVARKENGQLPRQEQQHVPQGHHTQQEVLQQQKQAQQRGAALRDPVAIDLTLSSDDDGGGVWNESEEDDWRSVLDTISRRPLEPPTALPPSSAPEPTTAISASPGALVPSGTSAECDVANHEAIPPQQVPEGGGCSAMLPLVDGRGK